MPKLGMGPVRREQICRAAAKVISVAGFAGTTMRMVAEEAGVSTGMLNHYFSNRMEMLEETLLFVSSRQQARESAAIDGLEPGVDRLRSLIHSVLPLDQETMEAWRVWIAAHGESVHLPHLRGVMATRNDSWFQIMDSGLEGVVPEGDDRIPYAWQLDALLTGLVLYAITTEAAVSLPEIENAVVDAAVARGEAARTKRGTGRRRPARTHTAKSR
jgi:TetR/AcrR family transcriptional repressor of bet genes